jgi:beta-xylosidase
MSRSTSTGAGYAVQPRLAVLLATLLATCVMSAVAQKGGAFTQLALAEPHPSPALTKVNYVSPLQAYPSPTPSIAGLNYANPVLAGNYPDPSVIRVGQDYWATSTSAGWAPQFPILHSRNLVDWEVVGSVFEQRPAWSNGNYWAPEISRYRGRYYIYYVGRKVGGPRCVAVATARHPTGPYTDHGPLVCQDVGSIDPMAVSDENGWRYLVWKEGNSGDRPTPIWAQRLSRDGTRLIGGRTELIRNNAPWEARVVEAPFIMRRGGWFYMFYSGNDCCGLQCNYALGVARSQYLLGPWEKNPANPILRGNEKWKCPGHGSIVTDAQGRDYLLYHAYEKNAVYVGRQALLDEVTWGTNQWPAIAQGSMPSTGALSTVDMTGSAPRHSFFDDFTSARLMPGWHWPQANQPLTRIQRARNGWLTLASASATARDVISAIVAQSTTVGDYVATTIVDTRGMKRGALGGLAAYGNGENAMGIVVGNGKVTVWRRELNQHQVVAVANAPKSPVVHLRMIAAAGHQFRFAMSQNGQTWKELGDKRGSYLPPWDHAVRVALTSGGIAGAVARFDQIRIVPTGPAPALMLAGTPEVPAR